MTLLNVKEVAQILRITKQTVCALIRRGELPARKVGREYRLLDTDIEEFAKGDKNGKQV